MNNFSASKPLKLLVPKWLSLKESACLFNSESRGKVNCLMSILPQASGNSFRTEVVLISEKNEPRWTQRKCERKRKKLRRSATVENPAVYMKNTNKVTTLVLQCDFYVTRSASEWGNVWSFFHLFSFQKVCIKQWMQIHYFIVLVIT